MRIAWRKPIKFEVSEVAHVSRSTSERRASCAKKKKQSLAITTLCGHVANTEAGAHGLAWRIRFRSVPDGASESKNEEVSLSASERCASRAKKQSNEITTLRRHVENSEARLGKHLVRKHGAENEVQSPHRKRSHEVQPRWCCRNSAILRASVPALQDVVFICARVQIRRLLGRTWNGHPREGRGMPSPHP